MKTVGIRSVFDLIDKNTVYRLIKEKRLFLPKKELDPKKDKPWNAKKINSQMLQGIVNGEDIPTIARRIQSVVKSNAEASIRTARTMCTASENLGRMDMLHEAENLGLEMKKVWLASSDTRTRDWHAELDGVEKDVDEPFNNEYGDIMFPGDPDADPANVYNCRCSLTYEVVGFNG